jgi:uncharacterized membrane protein (DUF2068 family)
MPNVKAQPRPATKTSTGSTTILLIAVFKLVKGILLLMVAVGALKLFHHNTADTVTRWVHILRVDPDNRHIHALLSRIFRVTPQQLRALSLGTFLYAALFLTEGTGLLLRKKWAEYLTIITTGGLIPLEVYEIQKHPTPVKLLVLAVNIAIVVYLVMRLRRGPR